MGMTEIPARGATGGRRPRRSNTRAGKLAAAAARRLSALLLTVVASVVLGTALVRLAPGFGMDERQMDLRLSEESVAAIRAQGQSTSILTACREYLAGLARGDWGVSVSLGRPVRELMADRAGLTVRTVLGGLALAWALSLGVGFGLAVARGRAWDTSATLVTGALLCLPTGIVALVFLYFAAPPALALAAVLFPRVFRYVRNILQASARRPHVLAARARGSGTLALVWRHVSIPSLPELFALAGVSLSMAVGAIIPVEALCDSPGVGQLVWQSAMGRDLPVLMHATVLVAVVTCAANLFSDTARALVSREV